MKKLVLYLSMVMMVGALTACGGGDAEQESGTQSTVESSVAVESEPVVESTTEPSQEGGAGVDISNGWSEEMSAVRTAVVDALGENYWPDMAVDPEILEAFYGISPDMYDDYLAEMPSMSAHVDTLLIIKAKDDKVEAVEEVLHNYHDTLVNDTMQYPANIGKIQASRVERIGNYVCYVALGGDITSLQDAGDEAVIEYCQQQNELAIEVISRNLAH